MAFDGDKITIAKLDESNYAVWNVKMKHLLISKEWWAAINAPLVAEAEGQEAPLHQFDAKALSLITLSVADHMLPLISDATTALEAWNTLKDVYRSASTAQLIRLKKELIALHVGDDESITKYMARASTLRDKLQAAGNTISEDDLVIAILAGLPKQFSTVRSIVENLSEIPAVSDLMARLMVVEERNKSNFSGALATTSTATAATTTAATARRPGCATTARRRATSSLTAARRSSPTSGALAATSPLSS